MDPPSTHADGYAHETASVLTKGILRSAEALGLTRAELSRVLGVSESHILHMASGKARIEVGTKQAELAMLLIRVDLSLDALLGKSDRQRKLWMDGFNHAFNEAPREAIQRSDGLVRVVHYLECAGTLN